MSESTAIPPAPLPIATADEMRAWERECFGSGDVSERVVMEAAGRAVAAAIASEFPAGRIVAAVGKGNNGGDAIVALRTLAAAGRAVLAVPAGSDPPDPRLAHGWRIPVAPPSPEVFRSADVIVDGLLGTGASGAPRDPLAGMIRWMNEADAPVVAVDGPSGVDMTTGATPGDAVRATFTVTFGALKRGHVLHPGRRLSGRVILAEVGFPPVPADAFAAAGITDSWARARLPRVPLDSHKGSVGLVGVVAGSEGVGGAIVMASMGALRAGCGGVRAFSVASNRVIVNTAVPEAVFFDRAGADLHQALGRTRAVLIGPGMGTDDDALSLLGSILARYEGGFVIDADALTLVASNEGLLSEAVAGRCVLTPHPGEMARLLGTDTPTILRDRFGTAREAADRYGCVVLAKGAPTLVAAPGEPMLVALSGHVGVAGAGMGDTLAGVVAALVATGATPREAAAMGVHFAGRAAEAGGRGRGLLPRDVAEALPEALFGSAPRSAPNWPFVFDLPPPR